MPTLQGLESDLGLAHRLADAARSISLARFRGELQRRIKPDGSIVTDADEAVEDAIRAMLARERPGDAVLGEERGESGSGARRWIIDGIDGTHEFAAGSPDWGTLIALEVDARIVVGVCDSPVHDRRYWAVAGNGAYCTRAGGITERISVSGTQGIRAARSYVPSENWLPDERVRSFARALRENTHVLAHSEHPVLQLAAGGYDIVFYCMVGPWDLAAPLLVVEEAGGRFSNLEGSYDYCCGSAVFSNGPLHADLLRLASGDDLLPRPQSL